MTKYEPQKQKCEDIHELLFAYMNRELGGARSDLVREHLRKCEKCQAAAREIQATLDLLKEVSQKEVFPEKLSDKRRRHITWALMHPGLAWIYRHHRLVSIIAMILALALGAFLMWTITVEDPEPFDPGVQVIIGRPGDDVGADPFKGYVPGTNEVGIPIGLEQPPAATNTP